MILTNLNSLRSYEEQYLELLEHVLMKGAKTGNRTGIPSYSVFGGQLSGRVDFQQFPILTTKKIAWNSLVTELLWFLRGYTTVDFLNHHNCTIWNEWATSESCKKRGVPEGDLGPIYGEQWRHWGGYDYTRPVTLKDVAFDEPGDGVNAANKVQWMTSTLLANIRTLYGLPNLCDRWKNDYNVFCHEVSLMPGFPKWARNPRGYELRSFHLGGVLAPNTSAFFPLHVSAVFPRLPSLPVDQIAALIHEAKTNPDSRRLVVNSWNADAIPTQALTPCHNMFQVSVRPQETKGEYANPNEEQMLQRNPPRVMDMTMYQRSADIFLGVPFNFTSYALLLGMIAKACGYTPGSLTIQFGDLHIYENHVAAAVTQLRRTPRSMPSLELVNIHDPLPGLPWFENLSTYHTRMRGYHPYPAIAAKVAV